LAFFRANLLALERPPAKLIGVISSGGGRNCSAERASQAAEPTLEW
jgi:hypothetical protein